MNALQPDSSPAATALRAARASRHTARILVLLALATACVATIACGPAGAPVAGGAASTDLDHFEFIRGRMGVVRVDTSTGQVWTVPLSGDGGWEPLGSAPDLGDEPARNARFRVMNVAQRKGGRGSEAAGPSAVMVRVDRETGSAWFLESEDATSWTPVGEAGAPPPTRADETPPTAAPTEPAAGAALDDASDADYPILQGEQLGVTLEDKQKTVETLRTARGKTELPIKMRLWAVRQLGQVDPELAVPELLQVLQDPEPALVVAAIEELGQIGHASTIPQIIRLKDHPDPTVREAVAKIVVEVK